MQFKYRHQVLITLNIVQFVLWSVLYVVLKNHMAFWTHVKQICKEIFHDF